MSLTPGTTVRIIDPADETGHHGKIGTVKTNDGSDLPYYVTGLYPSNPESGYWMRPDQVEAVQDGQTLTVSGPFREGESLVVVGRNDAYDGSVVTYVDADGGGGRHTVLFNGERIYFFERNLARPLPTDTVEPSVADLQATVSRLNDEVAEQARRATRAEERLTEQQSLYSGDMAAIQTIMREVKDEQSWCDDGYNRVVRRVNDELNGGWEFEEFRSLVRRTVTVKGETTVDIEVWVRDGDDEDDPDNWHDEDGDEIADSDEYMRENLADEYRRQGGFDDVEVA